MKKKIALVFTLLCILFIGWQFLGQTDGEPDVEVPQEFIDLVDNTLIDPLQEFKQGTVILAFHDSELGVDEETLREFKDRQASESQQFVKIDVNVQRSLARKYHVQNTPEYFVMKNGQVVYRAEDPRDTPRHYSNASHTSSYQTPSSSNSRTRFVTQ